MHVASNDSSLEYTVQSSGICGEYGKCVGLSNNKYKCACQLGYEGDHCELSKLMTTMDIM